MHFIIFLSGHMLSTVHERGVKATLHEAIPKMLNWIHHFRDSKVHLYFPIDDSFLSLS